MDDTLWNHVTGAKSKRPDLQTEAPSQQPMRAGIKPADRKAPTADQKRVRRQMAKSAHTEESTMSENHTEADLLAKMAGATTLQEQSYWGEALTDFRNGRRDEISAAAGLDFAAMEAADLTPTYGLEPLTAASMGASAGGLDWLADIQPDTHDDQKISSTMQAEATLWYEGLWDAVKADPAEFAAQTRNAARRTAAQFGLQSEAAASVFTSKVAHLHGKTAFDEVQQGPFEIPNGSHHTPPTDKATFDGLVNGEEGETKDPKSDDLDSPSLKEGDTPEGDKAQGVDSPISDTDGAKYVNDNAQGTSYTDPMPSGGKGASRKTAGIDVSKVRIKDRADNTFTGTTSDGKEVTFRLSDSDAKKVREVMFGDLGLNFSGLTIEQSDIVTEGTTASMDFFSALRQTLAEDPKSTTQTSDSPSLAQGETPEGDHPHSVMDQTPAAQDASTWGGDPDPLNTGGTEGGGNASPGAPYATASLQSIGSKVAAEAQSTNTATFGRALASMDSLDAVVAGISGRQIVDFVLASRDVSEETRRALAAKVAEAEGGNTCSVCGDKIAKDPSGEDNSTWHHDNGETHDHEAKPSGESKTAAEYAGGSPKSGDTATCHADGQKIEFFDGAWYHLKGGPSHNDVYPPNKSEREAKEGSRDPFAREAGEGPRFPYECPSCGKKWTKTTLYGGTTCPKCKTEGQMVKKAAACGCPNAEEGEHLGDCPLRGGSRAEFEDSGDAEDRWYNDARFSSKTATDTATVGAIPNCDICKYDLGKDGVPAAYDGATVMGPWANMCEEHFQSHGVGLGTGRGQRLVLRSEGSVQHEAGTSAQPEDGSITSTQTGNGSMYQRAKCKNCGGGLRRKDQASSGWAHSSTNTKWCPEAKTAAKHSDGSGAWKAQIAGAGESVWSQNGLTFDSKEEAESYAKDLGSRWFGMDMARVVPASTPNREPVDPDDPTIVLNYR